AMERRDEGRSTLASAAQRAGWSRRSARSFTGETRVRRGYCSAGLAAACTFLRASSDAGVFLLGSVTSAFLAPGAVLSSATPGTLPFSSAKMISPNLSSAWKSPTSGGDQPVPDCGRLLG